MIQLDSRSQSQTKKTTLTPGVVRNPNPTPPKDSASLRDCNEKKCFQFLFIVSDVIKGTVFGLFALFIWP